MSVARRINDWIKFVWNVNEFLGDERRICRKRRIRHRLGMVVRGFHSFSPGLYEFDRIPRDLFLSDLGRLHAGRLNGQAAAILTDKLLFERVFSNWLPVPPNVAFVRNGAISTLADMDSPGRPIDWATIRDRCPDGVVVKPVGGGGGKGIAVIRSDGDAFLWNGRRVDDAEIAARLPTHEQSLIVRFVRQAATSERFHPLTTNTLRILTMVDPESGHAFIARAVQRIGVRASIPVDNWTRGGLSARIDPDTGCLGPGATKPKTGAPAWHDRHPETGHPIAGETVTNWPRIRDDLLRVAAMLPMVPYVGWDVIPTDDAYAVIEGNFRSDVNLLQIHGPLLAIPKIRRFYRHHRIISPRRFAAAERAATTWRSSDSQS